MRGQGRVYRPHNGRGTTDVWWLDYGVRGQRHRESANTTSRREAQRLLRQRIGERETGKLVGHPDRVTVHELRELHEQQYDLDGRRTKQRIGQHWTHLEAFFHEETRALDVTTARHDDYAQHRLAAKASRQTVNNELASLRRGFKLAIEKGLLASLPVFKLPKVRNARQGFFEPGYLAALYLSLPAVARDVVTFLALTGWRIGEALGITWAHVDWDDQAPDGSTTLVPGPHACLRLGAAETKGGEQRVFPFGAAPDLQALLLARWKARRGLFVFHRDGKRLKGFRRAWASACKKAGLTGRRVHDLRRTFARTMRRAGVSEGVIMRLAGWRTRSMFDRYNVIDEQDLVAAVAQRYAGANGKLAANSEAPAQSPPSLTSSGTTTPL